MAFRTTVLFLSLCVVLCFSDMDITKSGTVVVGTPFQFNITDIFNLKSAAKFVLTTNNTEPMSVCVVPLKFSPPHYSQYNKYNCKYFFNFTNTTPEEASTVMFGLRSTTYLVSIYYSVNQTEAKNTTVTLKMTGASCSSKKYADEDGDCISAVNLRANTTTSTITLKVGEFGYGIITIPKYVGFMSLRPVDEEVPVTIYARYMGQPSKAYHDNMDTKINEANLVSPRPGTWVFVVVNKGTQKVTTKYRPTVVPCPSPSRLGEGCSVEVKKAENNYNLTAPVPGKYHYYMFPVNKTLGLRVSVATEDGKYTPRIYATEGNLPSMQASDIANCNGKYCDIVRKIEYNTTTHGPPEWWYVAVTGSVDRNNVTYGIWFNTTCVNGCRNGQCQDNGLCECNIDYEGIGCDVSKGLGPQYIVLIIIASLVVASAIIGFVAWAYMRRKRATYEIVS